MTKVIVCVRTRDEEKNIERFCNAYSWADKILVADGGSTDRTVLYAASFSNVLMKCFTEKIEMENGLWRNPHGKHINFLIEWAEDEGADWIIFDDCDSVPNNGKMFDLFKFDNTLNNYDFIRMTRLYLWNGYRYFPKLSQDRRKNWTHALWAWKASKKLRYKEDDPLRQEFIVVPTENILDINPEFSCLLHYSWVDEVELNKKLEFYRKSGESPNLLHPLEMGGNPQSLPEWVGNV